MEANHIDDDDDDDDESDESVVVWEEKRIQIPTPAVVWLI
jgi:hypothetical protein